MIRTKALIRRVISGFFLTHILMNVRAFGSAANVLVGGSLVGRFLFVRQFCRPSEKKTQFGLVIDVGFGDFWI